MKSNASSVRWTTPKRKPTFTYYWERIGPWIFTLLSTSIWPVYRAFNPGVHLITSKDTLGAGANIGTVFLGFGATVMVFFMSQTVSEKITQLQKYKEQFDRLIGYILNAIIASLLAILFSFFYLAFYEEGKFFHWTVETVWLFIVMASIWTIFHAGLLLHYILTEPALRDPVPPAPKKASTNNTIAGYLEGQMEVEDDDEELLVTED